MPAPLVPYDPKQVSAYDVDPATGLPKGGIPSTFGTTPANADATTINDATPGTNGFSANFLSDSDAALTALQNATAARVEAGRAAGEAGIKNQAAITREEIQQNQAEGQRQISYAQERLGGAILLKRNVDDFTANTSKFHAEIDRSLERLDIEMNNALATNNNNAWNSLAQIQKNMYDQKLAMYDRAMDVYYKNATLAIQQHEQANKELDTMLQWASLDNADAATMERISKDTGFDIPTLQAMGANAQKTFNAAIAAKNGGVVYPAALVPWQAAIDEYLSANAGDPNKVGKAIADAMAKAKAVGLVLSDADVNALNTYANKAVKDADAALAAKNAEKPEAPKPSVYSPTAGIIPNTFREFSAVGEGAGVMWDAFASALFGK